MPEKDVLEVNDEDMAFLDTDSDRKSKKADDDWLNPESTKVKDVKVIQDVVKDETINKDSTQPKLMGVDYPRAYVDMVERVLNHYRSLPVLDYDKIYKELSQLSVNSCPTPTLQVINQELQKVQAAKERVSEILTDILRCFTLKKRTVDILREAWGNYSSEKSADKRKGDAVFRLSDFDMDFAQVESAIKVASHVCRNLDSLQENLSRRITIFQLQLKLHDMGRNALPDFEFKDDVDGDFGLGKSKTSENNEGGNAKSETW